MVQTVALPVVDRFRVVGGGPLAGEITVVGAKNSALKLMAAALLAVGESALTNVPDIVDVAIMAELLRRLGCTVEQDVAAGRVSISSPLKPVSTTAGIPSVRPPTRTTGRRR